MQKTYYALMTTAPRRDCTLQKSLDSVRAAGWEPVIYAEPGSTQTDAETVKNPFCRGVWCNWKNAAEKALEANTDYIISFQDDISVHPGSKEFIERCMWPHPNCGFISLYTPSHYTSGAKPGINRFHTDALWGACALIFSRKALAKILSTKTAKEWFGVGPRDSKMLDRLKEIRTLNPHKIANSDSAIGRIVNELNMTMYFAMPSLAQHTSKYSTINHGTNTGKRAASEVVPSDISIYSIIPVPYETYP